MFNFLAKNFFRGVLVVVPVAVTVYAVYFIVVTVDGWVNVEPYLPRKVPGAGLLLTLVLITVIGILAGNFMTHRLFKIMDRLFNQVPLVKLLYNSLKDLVGAFVGEEKRFDKPVLVTIGDGIDLTLPGFLTREDLGDFGLPDHVAVYFPQSYNFAGNLLVVPRHRVRSLDVSSTGMMKLIVSGGVSGEERPKTPDPVC